VFSVVIMGDPDFEAKMRLVKGTYIPVPFIPDEKRLDELLHANVYEDDVFIVTFPKSGRRG